MNRPRRRQSGMTLIEMLAAVTVLMILTAILAQVFFEATRATAKGRGLTEIYQSARALKSVMSRDISGATADCFVGAENGLALSPVSDMPPGPYNVAQYGLDTSVAGVPNPGPLDAVMRRMLMGGSDYLAFTSSNATSTDKPVAKVYYVLRASGELIRVVHADTVFTDMDYAYDAVDNPPAGIPGFSTANPAHMDAYEQSHVIAENILRMKFSYLDRGAGGPFSDGAAASVQGAWVDSWDWSARRYLPAAIKVQLQIVDHQWRIVGDAATTAKNFDPVRMKRDSDANGIPDSPEAGDLFDPNNGEAFTFIVDLPLGMRQSGG